MGLDRRILVGANRTVALTDSNVYPKISRRKTLDDVTLRIGVTVEEVRGSPTVKFKIFHFQLGNYEEMKTIKDVMNYLLSTDGIFSDVENHPRQVSTMLINLVEMVNCRYKLTNQALDLAMNYSIEVSFSIVIVPFGHQTFNTTYGGAFSAITSGDIQFVFLYFRLFSERIPYISVIYQFIDYYE